METKMMMMPERRKLQIVVRISVNFWQCFSSGCGCYFATLWWPFAIAFCYFLLLPLVLSTLEDGRQKFTEAKREKKTAKTLQNFCDFSRQTSLRNPSPLPAQSFRYRLHLCLNSFIFVANFWHFSWTTFSSSSSSCWVGEKNTFLRFHFISYFIFNFFSCFSRLFSAVFLLACFLCAGHAFGSIFFLYVCSPRFVWPGYKIRYMPLIGSLMSALN